MIATALALAGPWATGQTVYRCGNDYGQRPCAGGTAIEASDGRTPAEAARASSVAAADARRADALEKARLAQEQNAPKAIVIGPPPAVEKPAKDGGKAKGGKLEQFTAQSPGKGGAGEAKKPKKPKKKKANTSP
jgi:hypothetical protein